MKTGKCIINLLELEDGISEIFFHHRDYVLPIDAYLLRSKIILSPENYTRYKHITGLKNLFFQYIRQ